MEQREYNIKPGKLFISSGIWNSFLRRSNLFGSLEPGNKTFFMQEVLACKSIRFVKAMRKFQQWPFNVASWMFWNRSQRPLAAIVLMLHRSRMMFVLYYINVKPVNVPCISRYFTVRSFVARLFVSFLSRKSTVLDKSSQADTTAVKTNAASVVHRTKLCQDGRTSAVN